MINFEQLATGLGPIIVGTFAIVYSKKLHESLIKFFNIKDYRLKPMGSNLWIVVGFALIVWGLARAFAN